eukprot:41045-Alexandrium_andersonii.AAC.1
MGGKQLPLGAREPSKRAQASTPGPILRGAPSWRAPEKDVSAGRPICMGRLVDSKQARRQ